MYFFKNHFRIHLQNGCTGLAAMPILFMAPSAFAAEDASVPTSARDDDVITLETLVVEAAPIDRTRQEIGENPLRLRKIVDLSEVLSGELVEASLVRKSGYGNEVSLRGFSQANLPVMVNDGFIEGACGSRKDPSLSHINLLSVDRIVVREGPFDVEQAGNLGGYVNVLTRKPETGFSGELLGRVGSFGLGNVGLMTTGGSATVQGLVGYNYSKSGQYADGNGVELWELREGRGSPYNEKGRNADVFRKNDAWGAVNVNLGDKSSLLVEGAYGEARDILTSRVEFDTRKETTKLGRLTWTARELGAWSEELTLSAYINAVGHYPTQEFRVVAVPKNVIAKTNIEGVSLKNCASLGDLRMTLGADWTHRDWKADVYNSTTGVLMNALLVPSVNTGNAGAFVRGEMEKGNWTLGAGARLDNAVTEAGETLQRTSAMTDANRREDTMPSGFVSAKYRTGEHSAAFAGLGRGYRVPTAVERYIQGSATYFGNPELKPTANTEADVGYEYGGEGWNVRAKAFYSDLQDYIYQVVTNEGWQTYRNIDAHIVGADVKGSLVMGGGFSADAGVAIQRGKKDCQPENNSDNDLGQMSPLKCRAAMNYEQDMSIFGSSVTFFGALEWVHGNKSDNVDEKVGEVALDAWDVFNLRVGVRHGSWTLVAGVENLLDETYALANSYEWDVVGGSGANPIIVNEPGRSIYMSLGCVW